MKISDIVTFEAIFALLSLLVSAWTLYKSNFSKAKITIEYGEKIGINMPNTKLQLFLPLTFINKAALAGVIKRIAIAIPAPRRDDQVRVLFWSEFINLRVDDHLNVSHIREAYAAPLCIKGYESITKIVKFRWDLDSLEIESHIYELKLMVWVENNDKPKVQVIKVHVSQNEASVINAGEENDKGRYKLTWLATKSENPINQTITSVQAKQLYGI
jgi:hypothetical protein